MQLGGKSVGAVNEQDLPAEMHIDWVRFLQKISDIVASIPLSKL